VGGRYLYTLDSQNNGATSDAHLVGIPLLAILALPLGDNDSELHIHGGMGPAFASFPQSSVNSSGWIGEVAAGLLGSTDPDLRGFIDVAAWLRVTEDPVTAVMSVRLGLEWQ